MTTTTNRRLLFSVGIADCEVQTFASGGPGGQHQNKTQSGVRVIHTASGARGECRETRHQGKNKQTAFRRMTETSRFKAWHKLECARRMGQPSVEELVDEAMKPHNIQFESKDEQGRWKKEMV